LRRRPLVVDGCPPELSSFSASELAVAPGFRPPLFLVLWRTIVSAFNPATLLVGGTTLIIEPDVGRTATTRGCLHRRKTVSYGRDYAGVLISKSVDIGIIIVTIGGVYSEML